MGGALFVASLAYTAFTYAFTWSAPNGGMNSGLASPARLQAIALDTALLGVFALHHSVLARERVKARLARAIPARLLRSLYVWIASSLLIAACSLWQSIGAALYDSAGLLRGLHAAVQLAGLWLIAQSVRSIDPLELAGIRLRPAGALQTDGPYRLVRHPLYLGWILLVFGAAHMTGDRMAFAIMTTIYLVGAVPLEERSLVASFGSEYERYRRQVKWRMIPYLY